MSDTSDKLRGIWGGLTSNGWLKRHPSALEAWEPQLRTLGKWLVCNPEPRNLLSKRERSLEIFGDEKVLTSWEKRGGWSFPTVLGKCRMINARLGIDPSRGLDGGGSGEPWLRHFVVGDISKRRSVSIVISENLDPWRAMRDALLYNGVTTVFGTKVDGAVFGEGYRILEPEAIDAAAGLIRYETKFTGIIRLMWWGDIDQAGLYQLGSAMRRTDEVLVPFTQAYARMLDVAVLEHLPEDTSREPVPKWLVDMLSDELDANERKLLGMALDEGKRVPQELTRIDAQGPKMSAYARTGAYDRGDRRPTSFELGNRYEEAFAETDGMEYPLDEDNLDPYLDSFDSPPVYEDDYVDASDLWDDDLSGF